MSETKFLGLADLADTGVLWMLNRAVFHPQGFAVTVVYDDAGIATGWYLQGDGEEPWSFEQQTDLAGWKKFQKFMNEYVDALPTTKAPA